MASAVLVAPVWAITGTRRAAWSTTASTTRRRSSLLNALRWPKEVDPTVWQAQPTAFERLAAAGVRTTVANKREFEGSGLTVASCRGADFVGVDRPGERLVALRDAAGHARMVSICTGASVLAAAGLLDGRPAATHWRDVEAFRRNFPSVRLDPDVLFVDDGDVLTSAGVAAGIGYQAIEDLRLRFGFADDGSAAP